MSQRPDPSRAPDEPPNGQDPAEGPVIRDKRRVDPMTGQVRPAPAGATSPAPAADAAQPAGEQGGGGLEQQLAERTADLQRVQAEYANYRRRVDRDRVAVRDAALANVLANLLPVLDDIGRARQHGELEGGFKAVAEALEAGVEKLGLRAFAADGDPFDPTVHEALTHEYSAEVTGPTAVRVFSVGYRIGERIVRPARVAVAEPEESAVPAGTGTGAGGTGETSETSETSD